tara:strand:- start:13360 stop:13551 length:192 start_codon:yes stop_codon:yes gene_type:complete
MFIFQCKKCDKKKELSKSIIEIVGGCVRTKNAQCKCGSEMVEIEKKEFNGFPNLIRTEPSLKK